MNIDRRTLQDYIAELNRRVDKLEAGGKPLAGISGQAVGTFVIPATSQENDIAVTLSWVNANVTANPKGSPYFSFYVDNDNNENYAWPYGSSLSSGQRNFRPEWYLNQNYLTNNPAKSRVTIRLSNLDSSQHTYYLKVKWVYLTGASGSG